MLMENACQYKVMSGQVEGESVAALMCFLGRRKDRYCQCEDYM